MNIDFSRIRVRSSSATICDQFYERLHLILLTGQQMVRVEEWHPIWSRSQNWVFCEWCTAHQAQLPHHAYSAGAASPRAAPSNPSPNVMVIVYLQTGSPASGVALSGGFVAEAPPEITV
jgi:hypothetical protein